MVDADLEQLESEMHNRPLPAARRKGGSPS
jgi:hypothetical protein